MDNAYTVIKNAVIRLLKELDPSVDVFAEEIKKTEDAEQGLNAENYYFIDIIPTGSITVDRYFTDRSVFIDIAYHDKSELNSVYLEKSYQLDQRIRPVFSFGNRNITVKDASSKTVDHVLHYSFSISFRDSREETQEYELMGELETIMKKGE
ncbi:MAG: translation initiation factor 2 [Lachnospiraceae bacterium]|nr:translation initiation factor 2 [Lachnospiraceae bacterium]